MSTAYGTIHPERLSKCFRSPLPAPLLDRLQSEDRFAARIASLLAERYGLDDEFGALAQGDQAMCEMSGSALEHLALRAGTVVHADLFLKEIRGPELQALAERYGKQAIQDARRFADLRLVIQDRPPADRPGVIEERMLGDGRACLGAWIATLPESAARRVGLAWPDDAAVPSAPRGELLERGPEIVRCLGADCVAS